MQSNAQTPDAYFEALPEDRKKVMYELREAIKSSLPKGFEEAMSYGMVGYVVPHSLYPAGYHCDPKLPLPFMNLASQKNFIAIYHMGLYADPIMMEWFLKRYNEVSKAKLDMGKSCIRFKKPELIPVELIGELASKVTPEKWIKFYEERFRNK